MTSLMVLCPEAVAVTLYKREQYFQTKHFIFWCNNFNQESFISTTNCQSHENMPPEITHHNSLLSNNWLFPVIVAQEQPARRARGFVGPDLGVSGSETRRPESQRQFVAWSGTSYSMWGLQQRPAPQAQFGLLLHANTLSGSNVSSVYSVSI